MGDLIEWRYCETKMLQRAIGAYQANSQTERQTDRQAGRQTDRQTESRHRVKNSVILADVDRDSDTQTIITTAT